MKGGTTPEDQVIISITTKVRNKRMDTIVAVIKC